MSYKIPIQVTEIQLTYRSKVKMKDRPKIHSSRDAYWVLEANWSDQMELVEECNVLLLDRASRVMALYPVSKGGIAGTVVDLKIVFAAALKGRASAIILAHNHPSGNLEPSEVDIDLTKRFKEAGKLLEMPNIDHLILSPEGEYFSFADALML